MPAGDDDAGMSPLDRLPFDNRTARLPETLFARVAAQPHGRHHLVHASADALALLDLPPDITADPDFVEVFSGRRVPAGAEPIATVYAGHQFGIWVPQLGDGRALLLGELVNRRGERWEVQLKGAGRTPYSRMGDGRAVLRSTIREYLGSEAMHHLGIPTTRAAAIIGSDGPVLRESVESGAILVRLAPSHLRFGHFQFLYYSGRHELLRELLDFAIALHFPGLAALPDAERHAALFANVIERTAQLVAGWQAVGFTHGVLNTDNMSLLGLTIDYGPFGFLDAYQPGFVCNHSDDDGRYAFDRQPSIAWWNLSAFGQTLTPLVPVEQLRALLDGFSEQYAQAYAARMRAKLGLREARDEDEALLEDLLGLMAGCGADYTNTLRSLCDFRPGTGPHALLDTVADPAGFETWLQRYGERLRAEASDDETRAANMRRVNPKIVLRNWLAQRAIEQAENGDYAGIDRLLRLLQTPFDEHPEAPDCYGEPPDWARSLALSCSS